MNISELGKKIESLEAAVVAMDKTIAVHLKACSMRHKSLQPLLYGGGGGAVLLGAIELIKQFLEVAPG